MLLLYLYVLILFVLLDVVVFLVVNILSKRYLLDCLIQKKVDGFLRFIGSIGL